MIFSRSVYSTGISCCRKQKRKLRKSPEIYRNPRSAAFNELRNLHRIPRQLDVPLSHTVVAGTGGTVAISGQSTRRLVRYCVLYFLLCAPRTFLSPVPLSQSLGCGTAGYQGATSSAWRPLRLLAPASPSEGCDGPPSWACRSERRSPERSSRPWRA